MNLLEHRNALFESARSIAEKAKGENRSMTAQEIRNVNLKVDEAKTLDERTRAGQESDKLFVQLMKVGDDGSQRGCLVR